MLVLLIGTDWFGYHSLNLTFSPPRHCPSTIIRHGMAGSPSLRWEGKTKTTIRSEAEELIRCALFVVVVVVGDLTYSLLLCVFYASCQCLVQFFLSDCCSGDDIFAKRQSNV